MHFCFIYLHRQSVIEYGTARVSWICHCIITMIEAIDQSNGFGGYVNDIYGGLNTNTVILFFKSDEMDREISFQVNIYGEYASNNGDIQKTTGKQK